MNASEHMYTRVPILSVQELTIGLTGDPIVKGLTFTLDAGETLGIVGESGSGKTMTAYAIAGLLSPELRVRAGEISLEGRSLLALAQSERRALAGGRIGVVLQDRLSAFNPVRTIGSILIESAMRHRTVASAAARAIAIDALASVRLPEPGKLVDAYPHQLSGGQLQRVMIALARLNDPILLIADEPTTALDVTVQARILDLIKELQSGSDMGVVIVTHDLAVAAEVADDVAVMYGGKLVETGPVADVLLDPAHPYTIGLLEANVRPGQPEPPRSIPGAPPSLARLPDGCAFAPRCEHATVTCWRERPALDELAIGRASRCPVLTATRSTRIREGAAADA